MIPKRTYGEGCPVAHALDLVGERWALLVVRELLLGPKRFTDLRTGIPNASPNVLAQRLRELERAGIVRRYRSGSSSGSRVYELTARGRELEPVLIQLGRWGLRSGLREPEMKTSVDSLLLAMRSNFDATLDLDGRYLLCVNGKNFVARVTVGRLDVTRGDVRDPDATLHTDSGTLAAILAGRLRPAQAMAVGSLRLSGRTAVLKRLLSGTAVPVPAAARRSCSSFEEDISMTTTSQPAGDAEAGPLEYRTIRRNIAGLLADRPDAAGRTVPATPEWTARDLLAHLTRIGRIAAGELAGEPTDDSLPVESASVPELIGEWERVGLIVDQHLTGTVARRVRVMTMDAFTHEFDIRRAVGVAWPNDHPALADALDVVVSGFAASVRRLGLPAILVESAGRQWLAGDGEAAATLRGHHYDVYRSLAGRRTREQITRLGWSTDPAPWLPAFDWGPFHPPASPVEEPAAG